jgi:hypothetical protein
MLDSGHCHLAKVLHHAHCEIVVVLQAFACSWEVVQVEGQILGDKLCKDTSDS